MGTNEVKVYVEEKKQSRQDKKLFYRHDKPNKPTKEGSLSFLSPFASVSTVIRGHASLVSLAPTVHSMLMSSLRTVTVYVLTNKEEGVVGREAGSGAGHHHTQQQAQHRRAPTKSTWKRRL
jgi:hypothetical protein